MSYTILCVLSEINIQQLISLREGKNNSLGYQLNLPV